MRILSGPGAGSSARVTADDHGSNPYQLSTQASQWYYEKEVKKIGAFCMCISRETRRAGIGSPVYIEKEQHPFPLVY